MKRPDDLQYTGIEAILRAGKLATDDRFYTVDQAALVKWTREEELEVWQSIALHSFVDPDCFGVSTREALSYLNRTELGVRDRLADPSLTLAADHAKARFFDNLQTARDALKSKKLRSMWSSVNDPVQSTTTIAEFHMWATRTGLPVVIGWQDRNAGGAARWTWGRHTTPLLEALESAAKAHWRRLDEGGQYDPTDSSSASPNPKVSAWIQERFPVASKETADVMARILRDPAVPTGRPREQ